MTNVYQGYQFSVGDWLFQLEKAECYISLSLGEELGVRCCFEIRGKREPLHEEDDWPLSIVISEHENSFYLPRAEVNNIDDIVFFCIKLSEVDYEKNMEPSVMTYITEHIGLHRGFMRIYRDSDDVVRFNLEGEFFEMEPFKVNVDVPIKITGLRCGGGSEEGVRSNLAKFFDPDEFHIYRKESYQSYYIDPKKSW